MVVPAAATAAIFALFKAAYMLKCSNGFTEAEKALWKSMGQSTTTIVGHAVSHRNQSRMQLHGEMVTSLPLQS